MHIFFSNDKLYRYRAAIREFLNYFLFTKPLFKKADWISPFNMVELRLIFPLVQLCELCGSIVKSFDPFQIGLITIRNKTLCKPGGKNCMK